MVAVLVLCVGRNCIGVWLLCREWQRPLACSASCSNIILWLASPVIASASPQNKLRVQIVRELVAVGLKCGFWTVQAMAL